MTLRAVCLCVAFALGLASADELTANHRPAVTFHAPELSPVYRGAPSRVELQFRVASGFHINSNQPKQEYLKKTELRLDPPTDIVIEKITYPQGQDQSFAFAPDEKLSVYSGDFLIGVVVRPLKTVLPANYAVHGRLNYQACDKAACYPPRQLPISFEIKVLKSAAEGKKHNPAQSPHAHT
jgi:Disulphide bond corrector protein DsbC